ncbi:MAG: hypothetical protein R3A78_00840 [Polyangiales bacterium]|nr:hypothetical protein [Myxococcales bacterium]
MRALAPIALIVSLAGLLTVVAGCEVDTYCPKCTVDGAVLPDAGDAGPPEVIATGGGGMVRYCAVRAAGAPGGAAPVGLGLLLVGVVVADRFRRRR